MPKSHNLTSGGYLTKTNKFMKQRNFESFTRWRDLEASVKIFDRRLAGNFPFTPADEKNYSFFSKR